MRIANYLRPDCVALRQRADSLTGAVQQMVTLLNGTDNLTDTAVFAADVRARLALGGVCVGNGLWPSRTPKAPPSGSCSWLR